MAHYISSSFDTSEESEKLHARHLPASMPVSSRFVVTKVHSDSVESSEDDSVDYSQRSGTRSYGAIDSDNESSPPEEPPQVVYVPPRLSPIEETVERIMKVLYILLLLGGFSTILISHMHGGLSTCLGHQSWKAIHIGFFFLFSSVSIPNVCHIVWLYIVPRPIVKHSVYYLCSALFIVTSILLDFRFRTCDTPSVRVVFYILTSSIVINIIVLVVRLFEFIVLYIERRYYSDGSSLLPGFLYPF
ncbi:hypothetical protein Ahia01_001243800 [Argonauta hians]